MHLLNVALLRWRLLRKAKTMSALTMCWRIYAPG